MACVALVAVASGCGDDSVDVPDADIRPDVGPRDAMVRDGDFPDPTVDLCEEPGSTLGMTCLGTDECDDHCFCNGPELCSGGVCVIGANPCTDTVDCTEEACLEEVDRCFNEPRHEMCSDGDACNGTEECHPVMGCRGTAPLVCNDEDSCTFDSCDMEEGCIYTPRDLDMDGHIDGRCGGDDCDDDPRFGRDIYPGAVEMCMNRRDDDCNGLRDFNDPACRPTNDACESATILPGPGTYSGSTMGLVSNYTFGCGGTGPDAVFRFTLTETHDVRISIAGGGASVAVTLRDFASCATGPEIRCTTASPPSILRRSLAAGEYAILVKTSTGSPFDLNLMITDPTTIPPVDTCTATTMDVSAGGSFSGMFEEVEDDYRLSCHAGTGWRDVALRFTLDSTKDVRITGSTTGGFFTSTYLALVTNCADTGTTLSCLNASPVEIRRRGLPAGTYYILLEASTTEAISWNITVEITDPAARTPGDACVMPLDITAARGTVDLSMMEFDTGTSCGGSSPTSHRDAFFRFTLATPRDVTLTTTAPGFLWTEIGPECGVFGTSIRCRSGSSPLVNTFRSLAAGTYFVTVATASTTGSATAEIVTGPPTPIPPNDRCTGAIEVGMGYSSRDTLIDFEDDVAGCSFGSPDSFYRITLPTSKRILATASRIGGMTGNVTLTLRDSCSSMTNIACDTGSPSAVIDRTLAAGNYILIVEMATTTVADYNMNVFVFDP